MIRIALVVCCAALAASDADADALYGSYGYTAPVATTAAYGYAAPAHGAAIAVRGYGTAATVRSTVPYGYAASGRYVADSVGAVHVAKREADADADADALYRSYGYSGLRYGGYRTLGYRGLGYTRSYGLGYGFPYYG